MTFPVEIPIGPWKLPPHPLLEGLAYACAFPLYVKLRERWGDAVTEPIRMRVVAAAAVGAAVGSKAMYLLADPALTWAHRSDTAYWMGGKSIVGGLLGGLLAVEWAKRWLGETRSTGDLFVLPLCLGMSIGRIGCFLTGIADHTYGSPTSLPWGIDFGDGVPRHPTQLYEIVVLAAIAAWASSRRREVAQSGDLFRGFMALYLSWRLAIDFMKPDPAVLFGLSSIQLACLAGLAFYARDLRRVFRPASAPSEPQ